MSDSIRTPVLLLKKSPVSPSPPTTEPWLFAVDSGIPLPPSTMFAPMTTGIAVSTVIVPLPTSATTSEVVVEEDCTSVVAKIPTKRPTSGSDALWISPSTTPPPNSLKAFPSMPMLTRNV